MSEELNVEIITHEGKEIHILSNGRKAVRPQHIEAYKEKLTGVKASPLPLTWTVLPHLLKMFAADLKLGMDFCVAKYNVGKEDIMREARRLLPHVNLKELKK